MSVPARFRDIIRATVRDLAAGNFEALERDGRSGDLTAEDLREQVEEYPGTLVELPEEAFEEPEATPVAESTWAIDVDLWTKEHGHSDLTLSAWLSDADGEVAIEIVNVHVM